MFTVDDLKPGDTFAWVHPDAYAALTAAQRRKVPARTVDKVEPCRMDRANVHIRTTDKAHACAPRVREITRL